MSSNTCLLEKTSYLSGLVAAALRPGMPVDSSQATDFTRLSPQHTSPPLARFNQ